MSEGNIRYFKLDPNVPDTKSDLKRIREMSDEEAYQNALDDPDAQPMTDEELSRMRRVVNVRELRERLGMTQEAFADTYRVHLASVRDWEQMRSIPDWSTSNYLHVIAEMPEAVAGVFSAK